MSAPCVAKRYPLSAICDAIPLCGRINFFNAHFAGNVSDFALRVSCLRGSKSRHLPLVPHTRDRGDFRAVSERRKPRADDKTSAQVPSRSAQGPIVIGIPPGSYEVLCACSKGESLKQIRSEQFAGAVRVID